MSVSEEALKLPSGWTSEFDPTYGRNYFHHAMSDTTQWEWPMDSEDAAAISAEHSVLIDTVGDDEDVHGYIDTTGTEGQRDVEIETVHNSSLCGDEKTVVIKVENQSQLGSLCDDCSSGSLGASRTRNTKTLPPLKLVNDQRHEQVMDTPVTTEKGSPTETNIERDNIENNVRYPPVYVPASESARAKWIGGNSQNYDHLAEMYRAQRAYADPTDDLTCVLCRKRLCTDVLFPCQHRCLCPECIVVEQVVEHHHMALVPNSHCNCPLCGAVIKKIIPSTGGGEVDEYWNWVCEINPHLPDGFLRNFRHSAAVIQKVYVIDNNKDNKPSKFCAIS